MEHEKPLTTLNLFKTIGSVNGVLVLVLGVIIFVPLLSGGFTTHDDAEVALKGWNGLTWEFAKLSSFIQGRFMFLWGFPLAGVPFVIDDRLWYLATKFGAVFLLLISLCYSVSRLFRSGWLALASIIFFLSFLQNGWEHNALTSYAFLFNIYAALILLSLGLFAKAIDEENIPMAWVAGILYFFAMGTELCALFFPFYLVVALSRKSSGSSAIRWLLFLKDYILAIGLPLSTYLAIYLAWRIHFPSSYDGNNLGAFNIKDAIKVIITYSLTAFPLSSLNLFVSLGDPLPFRNSGGLHETFYNLNVAHVVKPIVVGLLFSRLITVKDFDVPSTRIITVSAVLAFAGIFIPNVLLGFTARHQSWVGGGTHSYVYTYFSFISAVIFCSLLLAYARTLSYLLNRWLRVAFVFMIVTILMFISFKVEVRNQYFALDQKLAHRKWQLMEVVVRSPVFMEIPDGANVSAPTLLSFTRGYAAVMPEDWSNYVKYKTGRKISFTNSKCHESASCYTLVFRQEPDSDNQFAVFGVLKQTDSIDSSDITIYSSFLPPDAVIIGTYVSGNEMPEIVINQDPVLKAAHGLFAVKLNYKSNNNFTEVARLKANVAIAPEQIIISRYGIEPELRSWTEQLADGIDFKEREYPGFLAEVLGMSDREDFGRWTDASLYPDAKFIFKKPLPRKFSMEIVAGAFASNVGAPITVSVGSIQKVFTLKSKDHEEHVTLFFDTDEPVDTIAIRPFHAVSPNEINPEIGDRRKLGLALVSIKIIGQ